MATTKLPDIQDQIQTIWSQIFMQELREAFLLMTQVNRDYEGDIRKQNDTVRVSQINQNVSNLRSVGVDADTFSANKLETVKVDVKADKRAVSAYEFANLIEIQSIINPRTNPEIRQSMTHDIGRQINDYLYSLVNATTSITSATLDATTLADIREQAGLKLWPDARPWYLNHDSKYHVDMLKDTTITNADFGATDRPVIAGQFGIDRYGFQLFEDKSLNRLKGGTGYGLAFFPDWLLLVMQTEPQFKISDLHANKQFGYVMSVDLVFGAKLSIDGEEKHIEVSP